MRNRSRRSASRQGGRLQLDRRVPTQGLTCPRCGKVLNRTERFVGGLMPPVVCGRCAALELEHLKMCIGLAGLGRRPARLPSSGLRAAR